MITRTRPKPTWETEHPCCGPIPQEILSLEGIVDSSWHNNTAASFTKSFRCADPASEFDGIDLNIWVAEVDPDMRELNDPRFAVAAVGCCRFCEDLIEQAEVPDGMYKLLLTDDVNEVVIGFLDSMKALIKAGAR